MKKRKRSNKKIWRAALALLLIAIFFLTIFVRINTEIRFSRLNYVSETAQYAAGITEDQTEYLTEGRLDRAWKYLRTLVGTPKTYDDYDMYASIAIAREDYDNAANYLKGCIDTTEGGNASKAVLYLRLGSLYILKEDRKGALDALDQAVSLDPDLASARYLRAEMYLEQGDEEKAMDDFRAYVDQGGSDPAVLASLASVFESTGDMDRALVCYTGGIEGKDTFTPHLYVDRARCETTQGDLRSARSDLEKYFELTDEDPAGEAAAMLAVCLMSDGDFEEAYGMFHQAVDSGYANPYLLYTQSAKCAYANGDYSAAVTDGKKASAGAEDAGANSAEAHYWTGMAYLAEKYYPSASKQFEKTEKQDDSIKDLQYYLGICALAEDDTEAGVTYFTNSVNRKESVTPSLYNRGLCYLKQEKFEEGTADLLEVVRRNDDKDLKEQAEKLLAQLQGA